MITKELKFAVWGDIHYDVLNSRCVRLEDIEAVERTILRRAVEQKFDFTLFVGDRFQHREPKDEVKTIADRVYKEYINSLYQTNSDSFHYHLIGNHDWVDNGLKWHTSMSLSDIPKVQIMEAPCTYLGPEGKNFRIHALPSGFNFDSNYYQVDKDDLNIFVFHDVLRGSFRTDSKDPSNVFTSGIYVEDIDKDEYDVIFAGDIHIPQRFPLKRVRNGGGYVGSTIQLTKGDANYKRGWLECRAIYDGNCWVVDFNFCTSRDFFTRMSFNVGSSTTFEEIEIDEEKVKDQLLEVKLVGNKEDVDRVADDDRWNNFETYDVVRKLDLVRAYNLEKSAISIDMGNSVSLSDDLSAYIDSGFSNLGGINKGDIFKKLKDYGG